MKARLVLVLTLLVASLTIALPVTAADDSIAGTWEGTLSTPQGDLRIVFKIQAADEGLTATLDSPDQGASGIPVDQVSFEDGKVKLGIAAIGDGGFEGTLADDGMTLDGNWSQSGMSMPLQLTRKAADEATEEATSSPAVSDSTSDPASDPASEPTGFLAEFLAIDEIYGGKMIDLAKAIPEDKYSWRPAEGVRSISEAIMHAVSTNFFAVQALGVALPEGLPDDYEGVTDKDRAVELLEQSFATIRQASLTMAALDLSQPANLGGRQTTIRGAILGHVEHHGEHLGQLIAYARSVGVTPPWSQ